MIDATLSSFERDVIEASMEVPVIVDFWAPWCGPCKMLGPLMERLEREYGGRFKLVNVNADTNPELVASFNLKSIPYAVAFVDGNAIAQFTGAQPEAFIRAFLDRLIPNPSVIEHRAAREALAKGQGQIAEDYLKNAIALDPSNDAARLDIIGILLDRNDVAAARMHFATLSSRAPQISSHESIRARMQAAQAVVALPPLEHLERRVAIDPNDLQARLDLAELHISQRRFPPALENLLEIVRRNRKFKNDIARLKMLTVFEMAGDQPDLVGEYRAKLSRILF